MQPYVGDIISARLRKPPINKFIEGNLPLSGQFTPPAFEEISGIGANVGLSERWCKDIRLPAGAPDLAVVS